MYSLMIVDDEKAIREGLANCIKWEEHGFEVVALADDGKTALEQVISKKPQLILADIFMPMMDGIEFAKQAKRINPDCVIVFLSGYSEFSYAKSAIEIGVYKYLTKPLNEAELMATLKEVRNDIQDKGREKEQARKIKSLVAENMPIIRERFFMNLVKGRIGANELPVKLNYLNLNSMQGSCFCMIISIDCFNTVAENEEELNILKYSLRNICGEAFSHGTNLFAFEDREDEISLIYCSNGNLRAYPDNLYECLIRIQELAKRRLNTTVSIAIGRCYDSVLNISKSYREARQAIEYKLVMGNDSIICIDDVNIGDKCTISPQLFTFIDSIICSVKNGDSDGAKKALDELMDSIADLGIKSAGMISIYASTLVARLTQTMLEFNEDISQLAGAEKCISMLIKPDTLDDAKRNMADLIEKVLHSISAKRKVHNKNIIDKARQLINANHSNMELSLGKLANELFISPVYLSYLFKNVMGESFVEYLNKVRVDHAKRLLKETNMKVYEIADAAGYSNAQYFSICFKKYVGVSPKEYREYIMPDF